nr:gustatory receptor 22 [Papilio machaon]
MNALTWNINAKNRELSTIKPIILLERCFGIFRFRVEGELCLPANRRMRIFGFLICTTIAIFCSVLTSDFVTDYNIARIAVIAPSLMIFLQYAVAILMQLFVEDYDFVKLFTLLDNIDCSLRINMDNNFYKKSRVETMKLSALLGVSFVTLTLFDIFNEVEIKMEYLLSVIVYLEIELEVLFFYILTGMLRKRVVIINKYFTRFITHQFYNKTFKLNRCNTVYVIEDCVNHIGRASDNNMRIRDLAETYYQIGKVCEIINRKFNLLLFTTFVASFSFIIITFWTSLYYFQSNKTYRYLLRIVVWSFTQIIAVVVLSINCDKLLQAKEKTILLINTLVMDYDLPKGMRMQAKVFMETLKVWPLRSFRLRHVLYRFPKYI